MNSIFDKLSDLNWDCFKEVVSDKSLTPKWVDTCGYYFISASFGAFVFGCAIEKDYGADQTDFETNYKAAWA